jgi:sugar phosphate isomerase/epimerase
MPLRVDPIAIGLNEISLDLQTAIELAAEWGIHAIEIGQAWDTCAPNLTQAQQDILKTTLAEYGSRLICVSPGVFFAVEASEERARLDLGEKWERTVAFCNTFEARNVIIFSFRRTPGFDMAWVIDRMGEVAGKAEREGLMLYIETEKDNYCDSGQACRQVLDAVRSPCLNINWDAASVPRGGKNPYPDEYNYVRGYIGHVHIKDYSRTVGEYVVFGEGDVDFPKMLSALNADGFQGFLSVETHTRYNRKQRLPIVASTREGVLRLRRLVAEIASTPIPSLA